MPAIYPGCWITTMFGVGVCVSIEDRVCYYRSEEVDDNGDVVWVLFNTSMDSTTAPTFLRDADDKSKNIAALEAIFGYT